jgi:hypothetical protein
MSWSIYLPIAGTSVDLFLLLGLGAGVGFLSGLFGVGGGFLMTPLLIVAGIPPTVAAATDSNQIVAASASGTYAHYRMGNVDLKMGALLLLGGLLGGTGGVLIIRLLRSAGNAEFAIKLAYVIILGVVGSYMFVESLQTLRGRGRQVRRIERASPSIYARMIQSLPWRMRFVRSGVTVSPLLPVLLGVLVGVLAAIMGVGGGFLMVPVMVYLLRMPMHVVVGTSLFQILFTCANVTIMQAISNHTVDVLLAVILLLGSTIGAQFGARFSLRLKADQLKILLASIVLIVMLQMLVGLILPPPKSWWVTKERIKLLRSATHGSGGLRVLGCAVALAIFLPGQARPAELHVIPSLIEIGAFFRGTRVVVEAGISEGTEAVIEVKGSLATQPLLRKGRRWGLWMNVGEVSIHDAPSLYLVTGTRPGLLSDSQHEPPWGYAAIRRRMEISGESPSEAKAVSLQQFIDLKESEGLYGSFAHSATASRAPDGRTLVRWSFRLPSRVPPDRYEVCLFVVRRDFQVEERNCASLQVVKGGLPARLFSMAHERPFLYGVICVVIAIVTGFLMGFLFKRKDGH